MRRQQLFLTAFENEAIGFFYALEFVSLCASLITCDDAENVAESVRVESVVVNGREGRDEEDPLLSDTDVRCF